MWTIVTGIILPVERVNAENGGGVGMEATGVKDA